VESGHAAEMPPSRAVVVHDAAQVRQALEAAEGVLPPGVPLPLLSAPGAAHWLSPALFLAMVARGAEGMTVVPLPVLDCGLAPGHALAALRAGCPALVLRATCPAFPMLAGAAAEAGAILLGEAPGAFDMERHRPGDPRLRRWLSGGEVT
jgi:hypothetical protein